MSSTNSAKSTTQLSVCTTNYNCVHSVELHLKSVFRALNEIPFQYVAVDNQSKDGSYEVLRCWAVEHDNVTVIRRRCSKGVGRNLAFKESRGNDILVVDTDVLYFPRLREFVRSWRDRIHDMAVEAPFAGLYPRRIWSAVRGRRSLNVYEDADMWWRIHALGLMRWYPVPMGENLKEPYAFGAFDYASNRYSGSEKIFRLVRREWDLWKTREHEGKDLRAVVASHSVDFGLGDPLDFWVTNRARLRSGERVRVAGRLLQDLLRRTHG